MNLSTLIVLVIVAAVVVLIIRKMIKDRKSGNSCGCGCGGGSGCPGCGGKPMDGYEDEK